MAALFDFRHVCLDVDDGTRLLDDVTIELPVGKLIALVGPSGAGKSTLLRLCNGLERATAGTILWNGQDLDTVDVLRLRRAVGMVFQRPTPFSGTVGDNLRVADPDLDADAGSRLLERVELDSQMWDRDASTLSGGESQRMCMARSLAAGPTTLLMDEPTSALDAEARRGIEMLARRMVDRDGLSLLWVSHDRDQVARIADVVVELDGGRVIGVHET